MPNETTELREIALDTTKRAVDAISARAKQYSYEQVLALRTLP
jgi:hypothetical protein